MWILGLKGLKENKFNPCTTKNLLNMLSLGVNGDQALINRGI